VATGPNDRILPDLFRAIQQERRWKCAIPGPPGPGQQRLDVLAGISDYAEPSTPRRPGTNASALNCGPRTTGAKPSSALSNARWTVLRVMAHRQRLGGV